MIYTANIAGGAQRVHRDPGAAARRIAAGRNEFFGGIELIECTGVHEGMEDEIQRMAITILDRADYDR